MYYRKIGDISTFKSVALSTVGNSLNVMKAELANPGYDFEYYIKGNIDGKTVTYPVTGGNEVNSINKTVILVIKDKFELQEQELQTPLNTDIVYPNPVTDNLMIKTSNTIEEIRIYNLMGQLLLQERNPGRIISMNNFQVGVYLVEIITDVSKKVTKIVKQ